MGLGFTTYEEEQPFFLSHSIQTTCILTNGETVLICGGILSEDSTQVVYVFVTATATLPKVPERK